MAVRGTGWLRSRADAWRSGSVRAQWWLAATLVLLILLSLLVSLVNYDLMPLTAYFLWLLIARILLSFRPLVVVAAVNAIAGSVALLASNGMTPVGWVAVLEFLVAGVLVLYVAGRLRSALPSTLSEALLGDLKSRLQAQGRIPPLPEGWQSQSAMLASDGVGYAGDFLVADLRQDQQLEVILVDVCGKGVGAGPAALQFAGALGGLIGAMPPEQLFRAANDFLLRQNDDESFATAVHLLVDLTGGGYQITSAGHPPALRLDLPSGEWLIDNARGTALGVLRRTPSCTSATAGCFPARRCSSTPTAWSRTAPHTSTSGSPGCSGSPGRRSGSGSAAPRTGSSGRSRAGTTTGPC